MTLTMEFVETHNKKVLDCPKMYMLSNLRIFGQWVWEIWIFVCCCPKFQTDSAFDTHASIVLIIDACMAVPMSFDIHASIVLGL
jgi:hypothetical protein